MAQCYQSTSTSCCAMSNDIIKHQIDWLLLLSFWLAMRVCMRGRVCVRRYANAQSACPMSLCLSIELDTNAHARDTVMFILFVIVCLLCQPLIKLETYKYT